MSIKSKDIAKALHLSPATVSLALNNKSGVSEVTKKRIMDYIKEADLNVQNSISSVQNNIINFIIYKNKNLIVAETPFFYQLMEGIENRCNHLGYQLMITSISDSSSIQSSIENIASNCCGILLLATELNDNVIKTFDHISIPIVVIDNYYEDADYDCITINNVHGVFQAIRYLVDNGHKNIGYLKCNYRINNFKLREQGYYQALHKYGLVPHPEYILTAGSTVDTSYKAIKELLSKHHPLPTALFADNDLIALGAIKAFKEYGISIPDDISIIGFDNTPLSIVTEPNLTTINVPKKQMGIHAVDRLIYCANNKLHEYIKTEIGTKLIIRDSVKSLL